MLNTPFKPSKKFYDFTNMTDQQIEAELRVVRQEREELEKEMEGNVVFLESYRNGGTCNA